jgi:hypothetical protein
MWSPCCLRISGFSDLFYVYPLLTFEYLKQSLRNLVYAYHATWAHLNGGLHKSLSSVCVPVCLSFLSLLGNGSVDTFQLQQVCESLCVSLYCCSVKTFPRQQNIVGSVVFYRVRVVSKESRILIFPRILLLIIFGIFPLFSPILILLELHGEMSGLPILPF